MVQFESGASIFEEDLQTHTTEPDMTCHDNAWHVVIETTARFHSALIAVPLHFTSWFTIV